MPINYLDTLHIYVQDVMRMNPDEKVYLVEDNANSHRKAGKFVQAEREALEIVKVDWPSQSPDLNPIEQVLD